jgi:glyoxylase-like metal-dependent hydrolase (beta-lactamase superfamily II)
MTLRPLPITDDYTGHVETKTAARRTLPGVGIIKISVGPMDNNAYLVTCAETGVSLLIDAANDPDLLVELVGEHAPKLAMIVTTHQHFDHWQALEAVAEQVTRIRVFRIND